MVGGLEHPTVVVPTVRDLVPVVEPIGPLIEVCQKFPSGNQHRVPSSFSLYIIVINSCCLMVLVGRSNTLSIVAHHATISADSHEGGGRRSPERHSQAQRRGQFWELRKR